MYRIELTKNLIWNCSSQINALISGNRGSGKSFFAIYLLTEIARHKGQLFIVDLKIQIWLDYLVYCRKEGLPLVKKKFLNCFRDM